MSIDTIGSVSDPSRLRFQQIHGDFQSIQNDLQAGNIANAQLDFASLLKDAPALQNQLQSGAAATTTAATSAQPNALNALSTSLQAGDVSGAQTALTTLQQTLGGAQGHHHHHRHHSSSTPPPTGSDTTASGLTSPNGQTVRNDFQTLASALQSGDLTGAQQALAQLQKDAPRFGGGAASAPAPSSPPANAITATPA